VLLVILLVRMGQDVRREIDALATANSDSTQWSLAQSDVELLALKWAIRAADDDVGVSVAEIRTRFDIFYSRVRTVSTSPLYQTLRDDPDVVAALARINAFLEESIPVIDGTDAELLAALPVLAAGTEAIRADMRLVSLQGVAVLARQADTQRRGIAETLTLVSALTGSLFLGLVVLLGLLVHFARREQDRAREHGLVRARLASIIATSLDAVLVVDRKGRIVEFNGAAEKVFGYTREEAVGARMQDLIIPDHLKIAHEQGMARHLATGERKVIGRGRVQLEARRKNGDIFPVELSISSAASEHGELFVSFARDISRRVAAEQELIKARDDAVAGERAKADLIAVMSHEMRTPLNGMLGTLELLTGGDRSPREAEYLDIIRASGRQLLHHVDNVLEISRAEAGKIVPAHDSFSIAALVRELVESQRGVAARRGNSLSHRTRTRGRDHAVGDVTRIRQILLNLLGNAIKFTRNGSVTLEAERLGNGDDVEFRVRDTGIGIAREDTERVFEEFVTLDTSFSRAVGGTGLGLAIVKRLVVAMGGEVGVDSTPGEGSLFRVRLPLPATGPSADLPPAEAGDGAEADPPGTPPSLRILIVEDNRINRLVLRELLEQDGHDVDEAHDGAQGVDCVRRNSYDLVFTDISMPVMDGVEATRAIRQSEAPGTRLPLIAVTAHARAEDKERFRAAGLDDILVKPITRAGLRSVIERFAGPARSETDHPEADGTGSDASMLDHRHLAELGDALGATRIAELIHAFVSETDAAIEAIAARVEQGETDDALSRQAHHTAGSSALVGAVGLSEALRSIEGRIAEGGRIEVAEATAVREIWKATRDAFHDLPS
jgi:PAS domain S-box-containing protein